MPSIGSIGASPSWPIASLYYLWSYHAMPSGSILGNCCHDALTTLDRSSWSRMLQRFPIRLCHCALGSFRQVFCTVLSFLNMICGFVREPSHIQCVEMLSIPRQTFISAKLSSTFNCKFLQYDPVISHM